MTKKYIPITTITHMRDTLRELLRKRLGYHFKPGRDYFLCQLWSMDNPPDILEYTGMADRLDQIMGFHLSEEELMTAYDGPLSVSSLYLFNLYKKAMKTGNDEPPESAKAKDRGENEQS